MIPFLRSVAIEIVSRRGADLRDLTFVLPGKRACLFLERHISMVVEDRYSRVPSREEMPALMTFAELTERVTGMRTGTAPELIFSLFEAWNSEGGAEEFDRFRAWGETVIRDFSEIDAYDVDAGAIFHNIETYNEIATDYLTSEQRRVVAEYFGVSREPMPDGRFWRHFKGNSEPTRRFTDLWQQLAPLYERYQHVLEREGYTYTGALSRRTADIVESRGVKALPSKQMVMVGFDALTSSQLRLFKALRSLSLPDGRQVADFFWDAPGTPLAADSPVEAGRFQWLNMQQFPCSVEGMEHYTSSLTFPPVTDVVACPGNTAQAKVAGMMLADIVAGRGAPFTDPARVAVVLPDESLLFPMYYAVPADFAPDVNLTMGYPLRLTSVASFVTLLRKMQYTMRHIGGEAHFHFKEVRTLISHPFMQLMLGVECVEKIQGVMLTEHIFYLSLNDIVRAVPADVRADVMPLLTTVFHGLPRRGGMDEACAWLSSCLRLLLASHLKAAVKQQGNIETINIQTHIAAIDRLRELCRSHRLADSPWRTSLPLLDRMLQNYTVHLQGQPLTGVQIMGMLETRCLDFDYLIIPSMNERIFPQRLRLHTFIPDTLRRAWLLPTIRQKEQAYAYHFYRLIARAREVHLLYDASQNGRKSGDPSRYLLQLRYLFEKECRLRWRSARFGICTPVSPALTVQKRSADLEPFLTEGSGVSLSASNLKDFLACSMRFYLAHILRKKVVREPDEFMDAATQGTILHESMQALYDSLLPPGHKDTDPPVVRRITTQLLRSWLDPAAFSLRGLIESKVREKYKAAGQMADLYGDSEIMADVIERYARACLEADLRIAPFDYIDNEHKTHVRFPLKDGRLVNFTFIIDRLDSLILPSGEHRLRIVDYKTGSDRIDFSKVADLFHPSTQAGNTKGIFQLMLYALLLPRHDPTVTPDTPLALSIYATRRLEVNGYETMVQQSGTPMYSHLGATDDFRAMLLDELDELFDLSRPFEQTADTTKCAYCDFRKLCGR